MKNLLALLVFLVACSGESFVTAPVEQTATVSEAISAPAYFTEGFTVNSGGTTQNVGWWDGSTTHPAAINQYVCAWQGILGGAFTNVYSEVALGDNGTNYTLYAYASSGTIYTNVSCALRSNFAQGWGDPWSLTGQIFSTRTAAFAFLPASTGRSTQQETFCMAAQPARRSDRWGHNGS
jgi:hypothetical protein